MQHCPKLVEGDGSPALLRILLAAEDVLGRAVARSPDERVAWNSTGGQVDHGGVVTFHKLAENETRVTVQLDWEATGLMEKAGAALGVDNHAVKKDLANFKEFIEAKGIVDGGWRGDVQA